jgi:microcin C transport system permease protein
MMVSKWSRFKKNKRGYWSLIIFLFIFFFSLFADFVANDKPLFIMSGGELYSPVLFEYAETDFGGDFETEADYRDEYLINLIEEDGWIVWPPVKYSYSTINYNLATPAPSAPTLDNILGTDDQGRDVFARLIYGFRISVLFGLILTVTSSVIGIFAGAMQGYYGGLVDLIVQRFMEIWSGLPMLYLLIILSSVVEPNFWWLLGIMLLFSWMSLVGVVRAEFLRTRKLDYVKAARALGVQERVIIFRHILPNAMVSALTFMPFIINASLTTLASLDFLGFGLPPGSASLGEVLAQGKANPHAPWLGISSFLLISITLTLLIFIGEAVRDTFDPRRN